MASFQQSVAPSQPLEPPSTGAAGDFEVGSDDNGAQLAQMDGAGPTFGLLAPWFPALVAGCSPSVVDAALDNLALQSAVFADLLTQARAMGCVFRLGASGAGTSSDVVARPPGVTIDPLDTQDPDMLARNLSHELGHVLAGLGRYVYTPNMGRDQYITANTMVDLQGEAHATVAELRVRDDLLVQDGDDIGISGAGAADKIRYWEAYKRAALSETAMLDAIALVFANKEKPSTAPTGTYWDFYGQNHAQAWDAANPESGGGPLPPPPPLPP
jgi:hypothetical protein